MLLSEYTQKRAQLLYKLNMPEITSPFNMKIRWMDILLAKDIENGLNVDIHAHTFYEAHFVLEGEIGYSVDGDVIRIKSGEGLVISPKQQHKFHSCTENLVKYVVTFSLEEPLPVSLNMANLSKEIFTFSDNVLKNADFILSKTESSDVFSLNMICTRGAEMVYEAFLSLGIDDPYTYETKDSRFVLAKEFIDATPIANVKCGEVAKMCYLSTKQLNRIFKQYTGLSL